MTTTTKILITAALFIVTAFIIAVISSANLSRRPGAIGGIIVLGLLAALGVIWKSDNNNDKHWQNINTEFKDLYKLFDISSTADTEEIEFAYKKLLLKNQSQTINNKKNIFLQQEIIDAYKTLINKNERAIYDEEYYRHQLIKSNDNSKKSFQKQIINSENTNNKSQNRKVILEAGKSTFSFILKAILVSVVIGSLIILAVRDCSNIPSSKRNSIINNDSIDYSSVKQSIKNTIDTTTRNENDIFDSVNYVSSRDEIKKYYCIAIFYLKSKTPKTIYSNYGNYDEYDYQKVSSEVFEMTDTSEDEKYKKLDQIQSRNDVESNSFYSILKRELKVFDSYAEASTEREKILNINQQ